MYQRGIAGSIDGPPCSRMIAGGRTRLGASPLEALGCIVVDPRELRNEGAIAPALRGMPLVQVHRGHMSDCGEICRPTGTTVEEPESAAVKDRTTDSVLEDCVEL